MIYATVQTKIMAIRLKPFPFFFIFLIHMCKYAPTMPNESYVPDCYMNQIYFYFNGERYNN